MLTVVDRNLSDRQGTVTVQGDTQEEVTSAAAKNLALSEAGSRISRPGISGSPSAYPVDAAGETSDALMMGRGQVAGYRCDFPITGGL